MSLLEMRDVNVRYGNNQALDGISFDINEGDYLCIVGENGSGKSTLLKGLLGLVPVSGGTVSFGEGLTRAQIGYLPQQTDIQRDFPALAEEVVLSGCLNSRGILPFYSAKEKSLARQNMERLQIYELRRRSYRDLSGGQQQRVLLARALCSAKRVLFLDEPITGLDPISTSEFYELMRQLNGEGLSVCMTTHDVQKAVREANRVLHLDARVVYFGDRDGYLATDGYQGLIG